MDHLLSGFHKQTTLEYSSSVWNNQRKVRLNGEACFDVTKDKSRPFIVQSHGVDVKVYGTVFNVVQPLIAARNSTEKLPPMVFAISSASSNASDRMASTDTGAA